MAPRLRAGDVLLEVDGRPLASAVDLAEATTAASSGLEFAVLRGERRHPRPGGDRLD